MNIIQIYEQFPNKDACIAHLELVRWGDTPTCPYCNSINSTKRKKGYRYHCISCNTDYSVTVNTAFHKTRCDLQKWFLAIALLMNAKKSMSARQLGRDLGVNKDTAWYMLMRLRKNLADYSDVLRGVIEADEAFVGGKNKNRHADKKIKGGQGGNSPDKTIVAGLVERGSGKVRAQKVKDRKGKTLNPNIRKNVAKGSVIMTDEWKGYNGLKGYGHERCNHSQGVYVDGDAHTNTMENFWSLFKRGIHGQWHHITPRYMNRYLDEFSFRYENRSNPEIFNLTIQKALGI